MADFILGRLKFKFQGAWTATTPYIKDDVVRVGGRCYVCIDNHTSGSTFAEDSVASWDLMVDGMRWRGPWAQNNTYEINDIVNHSSSVYICNEAHSSTGAIWADNSDKFDSFSG